MFEFFKGNFLNYKVEGGKKLEILVLQVRAADELLKLTHDLKEFLILHDFNFLSSAIEK